LTTNSKSSHDFFPFSKSEPDPYSKGIHRRNLANMVRRRISVGQILPLDKTKIDFKERKLLPER